MKTKSLTPIKLVLCGPSDVSKEIDIAKEVVEQWNQQHAEARGLSIVPKHWKTDTYPNVKGRGQEVINEQIIDKSKILVGIFWNRFGTPTGVAESGTQEEILRAVDKRRKVMLYFSDLESPSAKVDTQQLELLSDFRKTMSGRALCSNFKSRDEFRKQFVGHLVNVMNSFEPKPTSLKPKRKSRPSVSQKATTKNGNNYQVVGDGITFNVHPPTEKIIKERRPGSVSAKEEKQLAGWISELAQNEVGMTQRQAHAMWGARFKNRFELGHREDLLSSQMPDAEAWYQEQKAIQKAGYKTKAPELYRNGLIGSIKAGMNKMGRTNEEYYPELSKRLKMKKPITHLPDLTKKDLERVCNAVCADVRKFKT